MKRLSITIAVLLSLLSGAAYAQHEIYPAAACAPNGGWSTFSDLTLDRTPSNSPCSVNWTNDKGIVVSDGTTWRFTGTVGSVSLTAPSVFSVTGSPVTSTGTVALDFATGQAQNKVLATPSGGTGAVSLRSLVAADLPSPLSSNTTGNAATATALASLPSQCTAGNYATGIAANGNASCTSLPASVPPPISSPNARTLSFATAFQASDSSRSALVTLNLTSTATLSLSGGTTNSATVVIGSTSGVASGTGTIISNYSNSNTGALTIGLNLSTVSAVPVTFALPKNWFFAVLQTSGTVSITSAYDQALG
jgi:hypothetical protein